MALHKSRGKQFAANSDSEEHEGEAALKTAVFVPNAAVARAEDKENDSPCKNSPEEAGPHDLGRFSDKFALGLADIDQQISCGAWSDTTY